MKLSFLFVLAASLSLSACFVSDQANLLLDPGAARQPIASGIYGEGDQRIKVVATSDGWYQESDWDSEAKAWDAPDRVLLNDFGSYNGRPLYVFAEASSEADGWTYGVLSPTPSGGLSYDWPNDSKECFGGASNEGGDCEYSSRQTLYGALQSWLRTQDVSTFTQRERSQ